MTHEELVEQKGKELRDLVIMDKSRTMTENVPAAIIYEPKLR